MKRFETLFIWLGWFALACAGQTSESGTNTNWLVACTDTRDCDEGICACGVCTRECRTAEDCGDIRGTSCLSGETSSCEDEARLCLEPCDEDEECGADPNDTTAPADPAEVSADASVSVEPDTSTTPSPDSSAPTTPEAVPSSSSEPSDSGAGAPPDASEPPEPEPVVPAGDDASTTPSADAGGIEPQGRVADGFPCGPLALGTSLTDCAPGEVCIDCDNATDLVPRVCVPHPETDPEGFAAETASCGGALLAYECDGPEDCATGERCITDPQAPMDPLTEYRYGRCLSGSPPCEPDGNCVVCRENADCDPGIQCAPRVQGARWPGRTCGEGLAELLVEGVWVARAPEATDRYSWLSFTPDGEGASSGAIRLLDAECDACVGPFLPCEGEGRYAVLGGTGLVEVEGPSGCGVLDGVSTWSFHTVVTDPPGYPPIALLSYLVDAGGMPMELHLRSPSYCDAEFTGCVLPDDL